jgi:hypothetical protein
MRPGPLANGGIFSATLINGNRELSQNGDVRLPEALRLRVVALRVGRHAAPHVVR